MPVIYDNVKLDCGYRVDLMVKNKVIVELKAIKAVEDIHIAQLLTYLKLANCKIGLLINFNVFRVKEGLTRLINKYYVPNK
nr:GxxExxY protein [Marinoscillum sp. MHG1-6]